MFQKINYLFLSGLIILLLFMIYKDGRAKWKESPGKNFYAMAAQSDISDKAKAERIKKKFGGIEEQISGNNLEKALLMLKQMETTSKTDAHLYFLQGTIFAKMKMYKEGLLNFLKAVKYDPDYVDEGCTLYKGTLIKEVTLDAMDFYKGKKDKASKDAIRIVYAMQRRLAGSCE